MTTSVEHETENLMTCSSCGRGRAPSLAKVEGSADEHVTHAEPTVSVVRGYTVRVLRRKTTPEEAAARRKALAQVLARSLWPERYSGRHEHTVAALDAVGSGSEKLMTKVH